MDADNFFETTFEPDFNETFMMARAEARYRLSGHQGLLASLAELACVILTLIAWVAAFFCLLLLSMLLHAFTGKWAYIMVVPAFAMVRYAKPSFGHCSKMASRMNARGIAKQKPALLVRVTVDNEKISWANDAEGVWLKWPAIERLFVTSGAIIFISGCFAFYIPRRSFADDTAAASFIRRILEHLPNPANSLSREDAATTALLAKAPPNKAQN